MTKTIESKLAVAIQNSKGSTETIPYRVLTKQELASLLAARLANPKLCDAYFSLFFRAYTALEGIDIGKAKFNPGGRPPKKKVDEGLKVGKGLPLDATMQEVFRIEREQKEKYHREKEQGGAPTQTDLAKAADEARKLAGIL